MGIFSRRSSSSTSTTNNLYDQRQVNDAGGGVIGSGSITSSDDDSTFIDSSNRSVTTINATDPGALLAAERIASNNAAFLRDASQDLNSSARALGGLALSTARDFSGDSRALGGLALSTARDFSGDSRALGQFALSTAAGLGDSVTDLYRTSGANTAQAWSATLGAAERLTSRVLDSARYATDGAMATSRAAISAYTPPENRAADTARLGIMAAAALGVLFLILRKS